MLNYRSAIAFVLLCCPVVTSFAQYEAWPYRATLVLLTTSDGADLPAAAVEENFPVLVRLRGETFDFSQAKPDGSDVRFSADGRPLAFQIEQWDPAAREAAVWVRVPVLRGNARQEIVLHWGRAEAVAESDGRAVFNASNGYAVVLHLGNADDPLRDEVGTVAPVDAGTASCVGAVGQARHFDDGQGIACGEQIVGLPTAAGPCSTEAWFRAERVNGVVVGWGNEQGQGKVIMDIAAPPHVRMECYFSGANVTGTSRLPMSEWIHVVHSYLEGDSRLYVNGRLDGVTTGRQTPLNVRTPARMWLGGWYKNYRYVGAIDEVRVSTVARSADWAKLAYENQKPHQTLVGTPIQSGTTFGVAPETIALNEGSRATLTAQAGGAEKVSWILLRNGAEHVVSTDRFSHTFDAGRVVGDEACTLRFKAVYRDEVKTRDVPIQIVETIPEPSVELRAPTSWNGRETIEVVPEIKNRDALATADAAALHYRWEVSGGAVVKQVAADRLMLLRSQYTGPLRVTCAIDNGGRPTIASANIDVAEPAVDAWVHREPEPDERPEAGQFYARDDRNEGTLHYRGTLDRPAESVFLRVFVDDKPFAAETQKLLNERRYAFAVKLRPGLVRYRVEFGAVADGAEQVLDTVGDLVCGDAYLIDGQSNALATDTREESPRETHEWIRSYGGPTGRGDGEAWVRDRTNEARKAGLARPNLWGRPVWKANRTEHAAELGWWGMELAKRLVADHQVPIFLLNAAVGGTRIDEHQPPAAADRTDLRTMYGRMLWRLRQARITHGIRAVLWHQGENDQGAAGPTGGYGWETYQPLFVDMSAAWKQDLPNVRRYYVFQIWPNACAMGGRSGSGDRLREAQRTLPRLFSNLSILSTLGIDPPGGCHYPLAGWSEFARMIQPLIDRDFYGKAPAGPLTPPNLRRASFTSDARDEISLEFDQDVAWDEALLREFYLDEVTGEAVAGRASGNVLLLKLKNPSPAAKITYLKERDWSQDRLLRGANGLAALTFCDVPIEPTTTP
jgi:hypothetical protein